VSASFLLATEDADLLAAWQAQLPAGAAVLTLDEVSAYPNLPPGLPIVVVLDALVAEKMPSVLERCPLLAVGKPHSVHFEQIRLSERAVRCMDYAESRQRLGDFLPLLAEIAERRSALDLVVEKNKRSESNSRPPIPVPSSGGNMDMWDFLEGAVENMGSRERLLAEFRRASRHVLKASHVVFFLREDGEFRADRGSSHCPVEDPLILYLSSRPVVLDGNEWPGPPDPFAEMAARNRMALWGARLLVPMHDKGHLTGIIACGVRNDGQAYDEGDKTRAVSYARLLGEFLRQNQRSHRLDRLYENSLLGDRYFPHTLLLGPDEEAPAEVPLAVRSLLGKARFERTTCRLRPSANQPFRGTAGLVAETGGAWAFWEDAGNELADLRQDQRQSRLSVLRELALTLNHEIGNAMVSLAALVKGGGKQRIPAALRKTAEADVDRLQRLNTDLVKMAEFAETDPERTDLRSVLASLAENLEIQADLPPEPVELSVVGKLVEFAVESLLRTVAENQPSDPARELKVQLRYTGEGSEGTALISIQGSGLELEGILPDPDPEDVPNQGRLAVFVAKEIVRLHGGEIHAGPGMEGTEILVSLRQW
jgi:hypothetical protein